MAKNIDSEIISITEICSGMKAKMRYFGKHCLDANGDVMPFNDQMAIVSHYMHNKGFASEAPYREKAMGLIEDIYEVKTGNELSQEGVVNDPGIQYNMFRDLFSVPFDVHAVQIGVLLQSDVHRHDLDVVFRDNLSTQIAGAVCAKNNRFCHNKIVPFLM